MRILPSGSSIASVSIGFVAGSPLEEAKAAGLLVEEEERIDFPDFRPEKAYRARGHHRCPDVGRISERSSRGGSLISLHPPENALWPSSRKTSDSSFIAAQAGERRWPLPFCDRQDSMPCTSMESAPTVSASRPGGSRALEQFTKSSSEAQEEAAL